MGRRLSADFRPLQDRSHMSHQSSVGRREELEETHLCCGSAAAILLSAANKHIRHVVLKLTPKLKCFHTSRDFADHFGIFLELDVVITLKLQQHHLQVDVVAHLKLPHCPVGLPVQGCCRGNVIRDGQS